MDQVRRDGRSGIAHNNGWYYYWYYMQTISLKLPDDLLAQLAKEAKVRGVTKSLLVRQSLETALRQKSSAADSCYDLAQDLAGTIKGLPKDLAENPEYLDGFGE